MKRLLILILASLLMLGGCSENRYAVREAVYPEVAPYPEERGEWNESAYEAWRSSREKLEKLQYSGYMDGLDSFVRKTSKNILSGNGTENVLYSPLNLYFSMSMLAEITDGDSRAQILDVLGPDDMDELRRKVPALWTGNYWADGTMRSVFANSVWLNDAVTYNAETVDTLSETYYASVYQGTMGDPDYTQAFRNWLNEQTGGFLADEAAAASFEEEALLTLASAVDYAADWLSGFSEEKTEAGVFHASSGDVSCDFMYKVTDEHYYWGENFAAISLQFNGARGRMWLILPDEDVAVTDLLDDEEVSALYLGGAYNSEYLEVHMRIPKFDISADLELSGILQNMGITDVFRAETADFSPLTSEMAEDLYVNEAKHAVRLKIDEKGCTAAVFTTMSVAMAPPPPNEQVEITFDRPFLFVVKDHSGAVLFMGIVNDPNGN